MKNNAGFTIMELMIAVLVLGVLVTLSVVSYSGMNAKAKETALQSDLRGVASQLQVLKMSSGRFPGHTPAPALEHSEGTVLQYWGGDDWYCVNATNDTLPGVVYSINERGMLQNEGCSF